jgi:putative membrane protein insertion efficiency factor
MGFLFIAIVRIYQRVISPFLPPACRFYPTCSSYSIQAIDRYGFIIGIVMTLKRLIRCHPFCAGGYDPVK